MSDSIYLEDGADMGANAAPALSLCAYDYRNNRYERDSDNNSDNNNNNSNLNNSNNGNNNNNKFSYGSPEAKRLRGERDNWR